MASLSVNCASQHGERNISGDKQTWQKFISTSLIGYALLQPVHSAYLVSAIVSLRLFAALFACPTLHIVQPRYNYSNCNLFHTAAFGGVEWR